MTTRASNWNETKFITGAIHVLQSQGYYTRGLTTPATGQKGNVVTWKIAGSGEASLMTQGEVGNRPVLNADRLTVSATMQDWEANEWIGAVDPQKMAEAEKQIAQKSIGMAIGRRFDRIFFSTLDAASITQVGTGTTNLGLDNLLDAQAQIMAQGIPDNSEVCVAVTYKQMAALNLQKGFSSRDYVTSPELMAGLRVVSWNGMKIIPMPDTCFNVPAANQVDMYMWLKSCVGFATPTGDDGLIPEASGIYYIAEKKNWMAQATMSAACAALLTTGIRRLRFSTNTALAQAL